MVPLAGLVLCGGAGMRMGTDKATLRLAGERLVDRVATRLATAADPVLIAPGTIGRLGPLPWEEVADDPPGAGPLAGLVAGLRASPAPYLAVVAVDLPFADPSLLTELAGAADADGADAAVPVTEAGPQPLHAVYARTALPWLQACLDRRQLGLLLALEGLNVAVVPVTTGTGLAFDVNLNHPGDVADAERRAGIDPTPGGLGKP